VEGASGSLKKTRQGGRAAIKAAFLFSDLEVGSQAKWAISDYTIALR
jgi:hypothetical protein